MKRIDELVQSYEQMAASYYDDVVMIELEKINQLYDKYQKTAEELFAVEIIKSFSKIIDTQTTRILDSGFVNLDKTGIDKVVESFCEIIKAQREIIGYPEYPENNGDYNEDELYQGHDLTSDCKSGVVHGFVPYQQSESTAAAGESQNDKQLQTAFTEYCLKNGKSSYTANDYCSRIKNLWKNFYTEYKEGKLDNAFAPCEEALRPDCPLLNVYRHADMLYRYILMKIDETDGNRNWTNARAAFNKFDKFKCSVE